MAGIYTKSEGNFFNNWNSLKLKTLNPICYLLTKLGITANIISIFSSFIIFLGLYQSIKLQSPAIYLYYLATHLILDGIDGTLARYQKKVSLNGTFVDVTNDHIAIVATSVFIGYFLLAKLWVVISYTLIYTILICMTMWIISKNKKMNYTLRPRLIIYGTLLIDIVFSLKSTNVAMILSSLAMIYYIIKGVDFL